MIASTPLSNGQRIAFDADPDNPGNVRIRIMSDDMTETIASATEPQPDFSRATGIVASRAMMLKPYVKPI